MENKLPKEIIDFY